MATTERKIITWQQTVDDGSVGWGWAKIIHRFDRPGRFRVNRIDIVTESKTGTAAATAYDCVVALMLVPEGQQAPAPDHFLDYGDTSIRNLFKSDGADNCMWWGQWTGTPRQTVTTAGYTAYGSPCRHISSKGEKFRWHDYQTGDELQWWESTSNPARNGGEYQIILDYNS